MKERESVTINIKDLIAICHIIDEFEDFNKKLFEYLNASFLSGKNRKKRLQYLMKICSKNSINFQTTADKFYYTNKKVIDTINTYRTFGYFITSCYDKDGYLKKDTNIMFNYIKENKDKRDKILDIINKLKELGFYDLTFDKEEKFDKEYTYDSYMFNYLDGNIQIIPSVEENKFRSTNANYLIEMGNDFDYLPFVKYEPKITLNNLIFDKNLLPNELSYKETLGKLIKLHNNSIEQKQLENSVKLMTDIENLEDNYKSLKENINSLNKTLTKEELIIILTDLYTTISRIKKLSTDYNEKIKKDSNLITEEILTQEQKVYKLKTNRKK